MKTNKTVIGFSLIAVIGIGAGAFAWANRLAPITSYEGVSLTDTPADVQYKLGVPAKVYLPDREYDLRTDIPPDTEDWRGAGKWEYGDPDPNDPRPYLTNSLDIPRVIDIVFQNGKVIRVECADFGDSAPPGPDGKCPTIYGLPPDATEDQVRARLGTPDTVKTQNGWRLITYQRLNVSFDLIQKQVVTTYFGQPPSNWNP
jgi:hypothetical protein